MSNISSGKTYPLGASITSEGVNFSVHSKSCSRMDLLLFDDADDRKPARVIKLDPAKHRTFHYWHVHVDGLKSGQIYAFRAHGPYDPDHGLRFDGEKVLLDPYGRAIAVPKAFNRVACGRPGDSTPYAMKSVVADLSTYDWEGDCPLYRSFNKTMIYEMHVRGFTVDPSSGVGEEKRGTYAGLVEKIPYLQELGITAVELLPVFQFDPQEAPVGLSNYWGYNPMSFFVPHTGYASAASPLAILDEFRDMVKALHRAGIEVILDVVYNHTAEGNEAGPTYSFKGLENSAYYILDGHFDHSGAQRSQYANYSGCGNTLNGNHSVVRRLILSSLRYWVEEMHVDGFRFDLASVLSRDINGHPQANPPILWDIETDPVLSGTKLIAEAWDAAGLYQVGNFFGDHWKEWNGHFRDDVRAFVKGDSGTVGTFAKRFLGSPDIYEHRNREPEQSINFVTSHDGYTMNDLVTYEGKYNEANKESNRDGHNENVSWNCGVEGPTDDPEIERLRTKQIKNLFTINVLAFGVPMLLMGDEMRRTQNGNNNAYCQDNEISWLDWKLLEKHAGIHRFVKYLLDYRKRLPERADPHLTLANVISLSQVRWHGREVDCPDWSDQSHSIAFTIPAADRWFHLIFNTYWKPIEFELPQVPDHFHPWKRMIDTDLPSPHDIGEGAPLENVASYLVQSRSSVVLLADRKRLG
ncbi:glycogen debranching protein GlgX [Aporhodopirellula aestuarii]|uniref:Glycogen debranching protein GlgX n=1 Tax=Aporhodopirellula aestuarii TaxID=2950107 RepID=A0ABT0U8D5_9BACT|nr:glycogen debranching protein GlgX [Aporhodopirellula aestuarii]MCM2372668.1 glycogen debranching protein GlgX [Aporhodopirellula aestuarii]